MNQAQTSYRYVSNYTEVFSCFFMHDFYSNRICNEIIFKPTLETEILIKNLQLLFKTNGGGFSLAINTSKDYSSAVFKVPFNLNFEFRFTNPFFNSFSAINFDPETRYFLEENWKSSVLLGSEMQNNSTELDRPGISGILRVSHTPDFPILPLDYSNAGKFLARSKVVYIKPREVKLIYICYASDVNLDHFEGLGIAMEGVFQGIISFGMPAQCKTPSGLNALKFTSETPLLMKASWRGVFKLERRNQLGYYRKSLPNPNPQSIKYDITTNSFISENYVKL